MLDLGRKVFVSYKYKDSNVKAISGVMQPTWPCDYVDYIKNKILSGDDVYKGEKSDEDISSWSETAIWEHLKSKIYDSTITIVLISPNMKEGDELLKRKKVWDKKRPNTEENPMREPLTDVAKELCNYFDGDEKFDDKYSGWCKALIDSYKKYLVDEITYGQAQK